MATTGADVKVSAEEAPCVQSLQHKKAELRSLSSRRHLEVESGIYPGSVSSGKWKNSRTVQTDGMEVLFSTLLYTLYFKRRHSR